MSEDPESSKPPGIVYTFYSYKGGVGRSMALVNVGVMLATQGLNVLLVDWDIEAPGLEVFFRQHATVTRDPAEVPGIVDILEAKTSGRALTWRECLLKIEFAGHSLDLITAGSKTDDYRQRVQQLNWETLFSEQHAIGNYFDAMRGEWKNVYDVVLVDSRTGITDIGDICTVLLPDVIVLMFVTNYQNIEGIKAIMERALRVRDKLPIQRSRLLGVPVPARDERDRESTKFEEWHGIFARQFSEFYREWLPRRVEPSDALHRLYIPYVAAWSFGESIPVLASERERADPSSIGAAYARLATLLGARLDWAALDAKASVSDLAAARLEASSSREAARAAEEARQRAELERAEAEQARAALEQELQTAGRSRWRKEFAVLAALLLVVGVASGLYYVWSQSTSTLITRVRAGNDSFDTWLTLAYDRELTPVQRATIADAIAQYIRKPGANRQKALLVIDKFDPEGRYADEVATVLADKDGFDAGYAATYLAGLGSRSERYVANIAALLSSKNSGTQIAAVRALEQIGPGAVQPYRAQITELTKSPIEALQEAARSALKKANQAPAK